MKYQKEEIKAALLRGGLVVASRAAGKTHAIAEILREDENAIAVIRYEANRKALLIAGINPEQVISVTMLDGSLLFGKLEDKRLYGDELTLAQLETLIRRREFHAAVTSFNFPVRVVK